MSAVCIFLPALSGLVLFVMNRSGAKVLRAFTLLSLCVTGLFCAASLFVGSSVRFSLFFSGLVFSLRADGLSVLFSLLGVFLFFLCTVFAFEYMKKEERENQFFAFLLLSFSGFLGMTLSENLFTAYVFFEMITLCSFPLVLHERTKAALYGGMKYLFYSIGGSLLALFGVFLLCFNGSCTFSPDVSAENSPLMTVGVFCCVVGFGAKAGMFPMQSWLPSAHPVAPAPASALLSGAITKAGIFMVCRVLFFCGGKEVLAGTWAQTVLLWLALITVLLGSVLALREKELKKRLAFSTVSQTSYILLGFLTLTPEGAAGGILHVLLHGFAKTALFLAAGAVICRTGVRQVDFFDGMGRKMPLVMTAFTLASLALVGVPPTIGFSSKWALASGALSGNLGFFGIAVPVVLLISAIFTAGYLLDVSAKSFLASSGEDDSRLKTSFFLSLPPLLLSVGTLVFGLFSGALFDFAVRILGF